ncbi:MAG: hypothetical protein WAM14_20100 [Candidatus Nitrosopolaris sp.]
MKRYPEMKFQALAFLLFSGILLFAAIIVWTTIAAYGVLKVTFPAKGQKVPVGNIVVSGTSSSNATNHCTVSLNINGIKPYQNVTPTGHKGPKDYSTWTFTVTPKYAVVKEGFNKITAKYSCPQNMNLTRFYSVNMTGVRGAAEAASGEQHQTVANTAISGNGFPPPLPGH